MPKTSPIKSKEKLFQILQKLSTTQLTKLRKLLESPYFHQTKSVTDLFIYLRKFHPLYPIDKVSDMATAEALFPGVTNGKKKIKNHKSDLVKLIEQFLILQQFSQQTSQQQFHLTQAYQDLQLHKLACNSSKKLEQSLAQSTTQGLSDLYQKIQLSHFQYYHADSSCGLKTQEQLQLLLDQLDQFFVAAKYKYAHEAMERKARKNETFEINFWENVEAQASRFGALEKQSTLYYYAQLQLLAAEKIPKEERFKKIKNDFFTNLSNFCLEDQQAIFRYLLNYISSFLNSGYSHLIPTQFELYKLGLSNKLLVYGNNITINTFLNIVVISTHCKAFSWTEDFAHAHKKYLHPTLQVNIIKIVDAYILFHQNDFEQAFIRLSNISFKNQDLEKFCLLLELKSIFETYLQDPSYYRTIISRLDSLAKKSSNRYRFSKEKKAQYLNYIAFVQKLIKLHRGSDNNGSSLKDVHQQIKATKHLIHKSWLLKKCDQMIRKM